MIRIKLSDGCTYEMQSAPIEGGCIGCAFVENRALCAESLNKSDCLSSNREDNDIVWVKVQEDLREASKSPVGAISEGVQGVGSQKSSEGPVDHSNGFTVNPKGGMKEEKGKVRPTLLFKDCNASISEVMDVLEMGAQKYKPSNWRKVEVSQYEEALLRHIMKYFAGETIDPESGKHHLAHAVCDALFIQELSK